MIIFLSTYDVSFLYVCCFQSLFLSGRAQTREGGLPAPASAGVFSFRTYE